MASGGISTTTSPSGRTHTPRRRASWQTANPVRSPTDATSMPVMVPTRRTSRTPSYVSRPLVSSPIRSPTRGRVLDRAALGHQVEVGDRRGAAQRVGRVGVAVEEGPRLRRRAEERLVDLLAGQHRRQRQVAAGQALAAGQQVGGDAGVVDRPHPAGPADAGGDLVDHHQRAELVAQRAHPAHERHVVGEHAAGGLHQRLDHDRADLAALALEQRARISASTSAAARRAVCPGASTPGEDTVRVSSRIGR